MAENTYYHKQLNKDQQRAYLYYKEKKISFTKMEEVAKRAEQYAKKGRGFLFHWRGGYLTKEVLGNFWSLSGRLPGRRGSM